MHCAALLEQYQLLTPAQWQELTAALHGQLDDHAVMNELQRRNWLTAFQLEQLEAGPAVPLSLGPYVLLDRLGEGGMGHVFKARHRLMDRIVAIKFIRPEHLADAEMVRRFRREMQALARVAHPNVVLAHDADEVDGHRFLVMEYVEGQPLSRVGEEQAPLPIRDACDYVRQAALGLQHAHERGLVHRDVKPSNLLLTPAGVVKVLDLGLALLTTRTDGDSMTAPQVVLGTPDYIAPEQAAQSHAADVRADLYSLGATLYFLLAGRPPFVRGTTLEKLALHQQAAPVAVELLRPEVPAGLALLVRRMMAKRPEDRPASAAQVAEELTPFCEGRLPRPRLPLPETLTGTRSPTVADAAPRRWRRAALAGAAALIAVAGFIAALLWMRDLYPGLRPLRVAPEGGDFTSIAEAIKHAPPGTRILVAEGTYPDPVIVDRLVEIVGDGPPTSVVVQTAEASCLDMQTERAIVRGLTLRCQAKDKPAVQLTQGRLTLTDCDITAASKVAVLVREDGTNPLVQRCRIHGSPGNGLVVERKAHGTFVDCQFFDLNVGVAISGEAAPELEGCLISRNREAGVLVFDKGKGTLKKCRILDNPGMGVSLRDLQTAPSLYDCTVHQNGQCGVIAQKAAHGMVFGGTITDNGVGGIVVKDDGSHVQVERCAINGNKTVAGVMVLAGARATVESCDLTGNVAGAIGKEDGATVNESNNKK